MGTDGIRQYINIHNPPQELYDLLPFEEVAVGSTSWKAHGHITWFKPWGDDTRLTVSLHGMPKELNVEGEGYAFHAHAD